MSCGLGSARRRSLVHRPEKIPHVFHVLHFIARCGDGHGAVHLLLVSAVERSVGEEGGFSGELSSSSTRHPFQETFTTVMGCQDIDLCRFASSQPV